MQVYTQNIECNLKVFISKEDLNLHYRENPKPRISERVCSFIFVVI